MSLIIRIDNQIYHRPFGAGGFAITPISLYQKQYRVTLDLTTLPYISTGCRITDNLLLSHLLTTGDDEALKSHTVVCRADATQVPFVNLIF